MSGYLLDVNVLLALSWPTHIHHVKAGMWFAKHSRQGWATCPMTQSGFARIVSNPSFSSDCLTIGDALNLLDTNLQHPAHHFWPDDLKLNDAIAPFADRLVGRQQLTDAYLLGLVLRRKGKLATLDARILALLREDDPARNYVEVIT